GTQSPARAACRRRDQQTGRQPARQTWLLQTGSRMVRGLFSATGCKASRRYWPSRPYLWQRTFRMKIKSERRQTPTISQVAAAAGVDRSTVSRAFTRPAMLSSETVQRVLAAAERLGYVPNHTARALSTGHYRNLALIVP